MSHAKRCIKCFQKMRKGKKRCPNVDCDWVSNNV